MIHYISTDGIASTWVANELREVGEADIPFQLHAMRDISWSNHSSAWAQELGASTNYLYPLPLRDLLIANLVAPFVFGRKYFAALANALLGARTSFRQRIVVLGHFFVACLWAYRLRRQRVSHIHSQWIHSCGTIGMYGAWLLDASFSFTGHAADLFRERVALTDKIRRADKIFCISTFHRDFFLEQGARPEQLQILYCGIDTSLFAPTSEGRTRTASLRIRSSGRLVEKKGFGDLIAACDLLRRQGVDFECIIAGSGPLEAQLKNQVEELDLAQHVTITGVAIKQEGIPEFMHSGDVYCLPCVWASDDDVDGLPQMLMEAMACGLPVVSTKLVGIPDLVRHEETGLLVSPNRPEEIAKALVRLKDGELAERLASAGNDFVRSTFDIKTCLHPLHRYYLSKLGVEAEAANLKPTVVA